MASRTFSAPDRVSECGGCSVTHPKSMSMTDDEVLNLLVSHGVLREFVQCGRCGAQLRLNRQRLMYRCQKTCLPKKKQKRTCAFKSSARAGTFLGISKLPTRICFDLAAILLLLEGPRKKFIEENIGVSYRTVVEWFSACREVFVDLCLRESEKVGGPGRVVDVVEAEFGEKKCRRWKRVEGKEWVIGGVERETGKSFLVPVESADRDTFLGVLKEWVLPRSTVMSDCWKEYDSLEDEEFRRLAAERSLTFAEDMAPGSLSGKGNFIYGPRKKRPAGYLAELYFKRKFPEMSGRLHPFLGAMASLYPPSQP